MADQIPAGFSAGGPDAQAAQKAKAEAAEAEAERRRTILCAALTTEAAERLNRVKLVKPERAAIIENQAIQIFLRSKQQVDDGMVRRLLEQSAGGGDEKPKMTIVRKGIDWSDSD